MLGDEYCLSFLKFILQLRKSPGKTWTSKFIPPGIEPETAGWEATALPPGHSRGQLYLEKVLQLQIKDQLLMDQDFIGIGLQDWCALVC